MTTEGEGTRPHGAETTDRLHEGGSRLPNGSGAHRGAPDVAHGAGDGRDWAPGESADERDRRHEAEQIGE
jgi:hypothetical protein